MQQSPSSRDEAFENGPGPGRTRALDSTDREIFDRTTRLVTTLLDVPVALITAVEGDRLVFSSCVGPEQPWSSTTGILLSHSACQHVIASGRPLPIRDAADEPLVRDSPAIAALGISAYLGVPLVSAAHGTVGTLCAIDTETRSWTESDVRVLEDLAATLMAFVDGRSGAETLPENPLSGATGLNIAAVAQRTGVAADTLRKWERRYGVLQPRRTSGGQRRYDENDVARVEWLRDRLSEGFRIGEAAALLNGDGASAASSPDGLRDAIVEAAGTADVRRLSSLVDQAFTLHDVAAAIEQILAPALRTVGDRWREGHEHVAGEHLLSEATLARLRSLLRERRHGVRGTAVLACAPGEQHEVGLLALAVLLQADGWLAVYLGSNTPLEAALAAAELAEADLLCLSATTGSALEGLAELERLELPQRLRFVIGGSAVDDGRPLADVVSALREPAATPRA